MRKRIHLFCEAFLLEEFVQEAYFPLLQATRTCPYGCTFCVSGKDRSKLRAFPLEQGITTPSSPVEESVNGRPLPAGTDPAPDPEISLEDIEKADAFVRFLAAPPKATFSDSADEALGKRGAKLFRSVRISRLPGNPASFASMMSTYPAGTSGLILSRDPFGMTMAPRSMSNTDCRPFTSVYEGWSS